MYGGAGGDHYSSLTQINRGNAKNLKQAWRFDTGDEGLLENTPLVVGRMLYAVTFGEKVIALDGGDGQADVAVRSAGEGVAAGAGCELLAGGREGGASWSAL